MPLKYSQLIESLELPITCPPQDCKPNYNIESARWVVHPIDSHLNFIPNHLYLEKRGVPPRPMDDHKRCGYCSVSLHTSVEASKLAFNSMSKALRDKIGYTHVAIGVLTAGAGLVSEINPISQHFELFEYSDFDWDNRFTIQSEL